MENIIEVVISAVFAILIVLFVHELGHRPKKIKTSPWYSMSAINADSRLGGLVFNALLFTGIYLIRPDFLFLQLVGLFAWIHFIYYLVFGSFNFEPSEKSVGKNYIWDDVPNESWVLNLIIALIVFFYMYDYYISSILRGLL